MPSTFDSYVTAHLQATVTAQTIQDLVGAPPRYRLQAQDMAGVWHSAGESAEIDRLLDRLPVCDSRTWLSVETWHDGSWTMIWVGALGSYREFAARYRRQP